jgi:hypothetical protein
VPKSDFNQPAVDLKRLNKVVSQAA